MKTTLKKILYIIIPLGLRKIIAIWVNRQNWLNVDTRSWWATQLIYDFSKNDINEYHKFLWRHHLSYAETYESEIRFGYENLNTTRKMFFSDLKKHLTELNISPSKDVNSVFEVGCSLGYLLQYAETEIFTSATILEGNDIDKYAISEGNNYLKSAKSKVKLFHADMEELDIILGDRKFDVIFGSGILLYLKQQSAKNLVSKMLTHTNTILSFTGLAHPDVDNATLENSVARTRDSTWVHNIDKMITDAGGKIIARRWQGNKITDGNSIYFVFAVPKH